MRHAALSSSWPAWVVLSIALGGCGQVPSPAPSAQTSGPSAAISTSAPHPTASATPTSLGDYRLLEIPADRIRQVALPAHVAFHVVAADGGRFVMDEPPGPLKFGRRATSLFFVDLHEGTSSILTTPTDGYIPRAMRVLDWFGQGG
jgi:hypothetical protein